MLTFNQSNKFVVFLKVIMLTFLISSMFCDTVFARRRSILPKDFDHETYLFLYPDVALAVRDAHPDIQKKHAGDHYTRWGAKIGRIYRLPDEFNSENYLSKNNDLAVFATILCKSLEDRDKWAKRHYANFGVYEHRQFINLFPTSAGNNNNNDNNSETPDFFEYVNPAIPAPIPENFDSSTYISFYPDVKSPMIIDNTMDQMIAQSHYQKWGAYGQRIWCLPVGFDANWYFRLNPDLKTCAVNEAINVEKWAEQHYANFGHREGRNYLPEDFNWETYLFLHPELAAQSGDTDEEKEKFAILHFIQNELPYLPDDFNSDVYFELYPILAQRLCQGIDEEEKRMEARIHFAHQGRSQGRLYHPLPEAVPAEMCRLLIKFQHEDHLEGVETRFAKPCSATIRRGHVRRSSHQMSIDEKDLSNDGTF